jgi:hypothetical protein
MPRIAKAVKSATVKPTKKIVTAYADLEQGLLATKNALIKQTEVALADLKKQQKKLKEQLSKAQAQKKTTKNARVKVVEKAKKNPSKAIQVQLDKAKDAYTSAATAVDTIQIELEKVKTQIDEAQSAHGKYASLSKVIDKFNKIWGKKQIKAVKSKTSKLKASRKKTKSTRKSSKNKVEAKNTFAV